MRRREILKWLVASSLASLIGPRLATASEGHDNLIHLIREVYKPDHAYRKIGKYHLDSKSEKLSLQDHLERTGVNYASSPEQLVSAFESKRQQDFAENNTEIINGWVIARAEASMIAILGQI